MRNTTESTLAPYAVHPDHSRGRVHPESPDASRDPFDLDRHRIFASTSFRRLQYKTQVFVTDEHDHFRTRLTHTLEVAQIARRLAAILDVNVRLAEAIALAHDLGHPPFGHAGEATLAELMADTGGFEHNAHTLRVVDYLEHPYPAFRGLNLSYELREGLIKHTSTFDCPAPETAEGIDVNELLASGPLPSVEAQLVSIADRIAYDCHDLEDALGANLIGPPELEGLSLWVDAAAPIHERHPNANIFAIRRPILDALIDRLIYDCTTETQRRLRSNGVTNLDDVRRATDPAVDFSADFLIHVREMEGFLAEKVYRHHRLVRMDAKARRFIERLFAAYVQDPAMLPERFAKRIDSQGPHRVICDYIAGMTDRFCQDDYKRLFEPDACV